MLADSQWSLFFSLTRWGWRIVMEIYHNLHAVWYTKTWIAGLTPIPLCELASN